MLESLGAVSLSSWRSAGFRSRWWSAAASAGGVLGVGGYRLLTEPALDEAERVEPGRISLERYPALVAELEERTGLAIDYRPEK